MPIQVIYLCIYLFTYLIFNFIFSIVHIFEWDVCPCEPQIKVGRVEVWRKIGRINILTFFLFLCVSRGCVGWEGRGWKEKGSLLTVKLHHHLYIWAWSFDDALENMMWRSVPTVLVDWI